MVAFLEALAAAAQRMAAAAAACFLVGGVAEARLASLPVEAFEVVWVVAAVGIWSWLTREIVRPRWRDSAIKTTRVHLPSTSGVDFVTDAALFSVGVAFVETGLEGSLFGFGLSFLAVSTSLAVLRVLCWHRRPTRRS